VRALAALLFVACAEPSAIVENSKPAPLDPEVPVEVAPDASAVAPAPREDPRIAAVLAEVSSLRKLPIKAKVRTQVVDRATVLAKSKKKLAEELPPGVLERQGDAYRALELVPADYDLEEGLLELLTSRVAGFYDPDEKSMFLLDDLSSRQDDETLPHELVHALQDQSFDIGPMLDYAPGQNDRLTAAQHLVEGDATIYGFLHAYGEDFRVEHSALRAAFYNPTALSSADTPRFLLGSLVSPYVEGYIFVESLRLAGGSSSIDAAFKRLPASTEQILHPEKFASREAPLPVPPLTATSLGEAWKPLYDDTNGELGLRLMLEQWTSEPIAAKAAAGWGGDRLVVFGSGSGKTRTAALAFITRMDSDNDAIELEKVVQSKFGRSCKERSDVGPITWTRRGRDLLLAAGPFKVENGSVSSATKCADTSKWLRELSQAR
jgi:hypothetical protein